MQNLFTSIYSKYLGDDNLPGAVTGLYNTQAPEDAVYPYIVFSLLNDAQDFDSDSLMENALIQFNIFSDKKAATEICKLFDYLKGETIIGTGYDFYNLSITDYTTLSLKRENSHLTIVEGIWQYTVTYSCLLDYTGEVAVEKFYGNLFALMNI